MLLYEDEQGRLHFADLRIGWAGTTSFVLALIGFIFVINGVVQVAIAISGKGMLLLGLILVAVGAGALFLWRLAARAVKRRRERPLEQLPTLLILDLPRGLVLDANGSVLAPLGSLRFTRQMQATSSSRRLVAEWPGGGRTLVRGNPFAGGLSDVVSELERRGFRC